MNGFHLIVFSNILSSCIGTPPSQCLDGYTIKDASGTPFVQAIFLGADDFPPQSDGYTIVRNLSDLEIEQTLAAMRHLAEIVSVVPGQAPASIAVTGLTIPTAFAISPRFDDLPGTGTKVLAALTGQHRGESEIDAEIGIGELGYSLDSYVPSQLPLTEKLGLTSVIVHEFGHALSIKSFVTNTGSAELPSPQFANSLSSWATNLYDDNGNAARPGSAIWCTGCANTSSSEIFDARKDRSYFKGKHVDEVLAGAMPGLPVRILYQEGAIDTDFFSHSELKNSLMSHQNYRNFTTFMEAEVAALQDLGLSIDRRNFFGYSIYGDNQNIINEHPFLARSSEGGSYLENSYNRSTLGLGLHIYGNNNSVLQQADLLSIGAGGGGIRVDGENNHLTISPNTRVYADGPYGRGVMFSYGKTHTFVQRGIVQAMGDHGVAASFDFGENARGSEFEYRGSYIRTLNGRPAPILPEINGPLVSTFDLTGRVAGRYAAIYMSKNGYVGQINVMQGASIEGNILSNYAREDDNGDLRITNLTFGLKADSNGHSTGVADHDFRIAYDGDITGSNLSLQMDGGITQFIGSHQLYDVAVAQSARLSGKGSYLINAAQQFRNAGIVNPSVPGAAITIDGAYIQSESGELQLVFNNEKEISSLSVNGNADINGAIAFAPVKGWYQNGFSITSDRWLNATAVTGAFGEISASLASPTLIATAVDNGNNSFTVSLTRGAEAYAQYGASANSRGVGGALDVDASNAGPGPHNLIAALDFSAADGSAVRVALPQLSAEPYATATGVLVQASASTRSAVNNRLQQAFGGTIKIAAPRAVSKDDLTHYAAWGAAFDSWSSQSGDRNVARTNSTLGGFITGIDVSVQDNWRFGVMAGHSRSTISSVERGSSGSSDNYTVGGYAGTEWAVTSGVIGLRTGLSYSWHNVDMSRSIAFADFKDTLSADYNASTLQAFAEVGYKLNIAPRSTLEPYANLAYVRVHTDGFDEKDQNGAALSVHSALMDSPLSTLGLRAAASFNAGHYAVTASADFGWRHAYDDVIPTANAGFTAGLATFTSAGNAIGSDTALIETDIHVQLNQNTAVGLTYQGQFSSGTTQNGVNASLRVAF